MGRQKRKPRRCRVKQFLGTCSNIWDRLASFRLPVKACRGLAVLWSLELRILRFKDFVAYHAHRRVKRRTTVFERTDCGGHPAQQLKLLCDKSCASTSKISEFFLVPRPRSLRMVSFGSSRRSQAGSFWGASTAHDFTKPQRGGAATEQEKQTRKLKTAK